MLNGNKKSPDDAVWDKRNLYCIALQITILAHVNTAVLACSQAMGT